MMPAARRDLRAVRHHEQLRGIGKPREPLADRARHGTADTAVDLVEDHRRGTALLGQHDLQREDEARQFATRGDLDERCERRAGVGRDLELDTVLARRRPCLGRGRCDNGPETRGIELERDELALHRSIELERGGGTRLGQRGGGGVIGGARLGQLRLERGEPLFAGLERRELGFELARQTRQLVGLDAVLARHCAQLEQPRLVILEAGGIEPQIGLRLAQLLLGNRALDHRAVDRSERVGKRGMVLGDAFEHARRLAELGEPAIRSFEPILDRQQILGDLFRTLHRPAAIGERFLLARLGRERAQFADGMFEPLAVARRGVDRRARFGERRLGIAQRLVAGGGRSRRNAPERVEQRTMTARVEQPAIVMLPVDLDEIRREFAQQSGRRRLIVDEGAAAAIGLDDAADHQRLAGVELEPVFGKQRNDRAIRRGGIEGRGDDRLRGTLADEAGLAARTER